MLLLADTIALLAHGVGVALEDLPIPLGAFYGAAVGVLVASFVLLWGLWRAPRLSAGALAARGGPRPAPRWLDAIARAGRLRTALAAIFLALLVLVVAAGLFGTDEAAENAAPSLVFGIGWVGIAFAAAVVGNLWGRCSPIALVARLGALRQHTETPLPAAAGVWLAWAGLLAFTWLELVYPTGDEVRLLGALVLGATVALVLAMARWGIRDVTERVGPWTTYSRVLATCSPWERRADGRLAMRAPLTGSNRGLAAEPGLVALVTLLIGSVSYDGLSRTGWWEEQVALGVGDLARAGLSIDAARIAFGSAGFLGLVLLAWGALEAAGWLAARLGRFQVPAGTRAATLLAPSIVPIALGYAVAHYFSFLAIQVQDVPRLLSDPLGRGWDLLGAADRGLGAGWRPSGTLTWIVQVGAIVVGHVAGLVLAHDRALELAPDHRAATRSQLPMLGLMLLYTVGGLYFLSEGLA